MTKTTIISILILGVVGLAIVFINKKPQEEMFTQEQENLDVVENQNLGQTQGKKMAFAEFLKQDKGAYQCVVNQYIDESMTQTTQGTVFLHDGNIRGDFKTSVTGMNIQSSVIVRDGYSYTWSNMIPAGYKVAIDNAGQSNPDSSMSGTYFWNAKQIGDYDCQEWNVDMTKFELPSGVTFQEIGA